MSTTDWAKDESATPALRTQDHISVHFDEHEKVDLPIGTVAPARHSIIAQTPSAVHNNAALASDGNNTAYTALNAAPTYVPVVTGTSGHHAYLGDPSLSFSNRFALEYLDDKGEWDQYNEMWWLQRHQHLQSEHKARHYARYVTVKFLRRLWAEVVGTFFLVFIHGSFALMSHKHQITKEGSAFGHGCLLVAMIYALGFVSGAHFNPVVTLGFAIRGIFRWMWVPFYWLAQFAGAFIAAAFIRAFWTDESGYSSLYPNEDFDTYENMLIEAIMTFALITVILGTATRGKVEGAMSGLAVGAVISFDILLGGAFGAGTMNPGKRYGIIAPSLLLSLLLAAMPWLMHHCFCMSSVAFTHALVLFQLV